MNATPNSLMLLYIFFIILSVYRLEDNVCSVILRIEQLRKRSSYCRTVVATRKEDAVDALLWQNPKTTFEVGVRAAVVPYRAVVVAWIECNTNAVTKP